MNTDIEFVQKFNLAYNVMCKPLCQQLKLPQTAFDILMFFGNNPEYHTASDVVEIRRIKANLVSVNVDKLVCEGTWNAERLRMTVGRLCCSARRKRRMSSKKAA
ncbi:MAG: hypothetical protein ACLTG0_10570 [Oscillibacter sp.]